MSTLLKLGPDCCWQAANSIAKQMAKMRNRDWCMTRGCGLRRRSGRVVVDQKRPKDRGEVNDRVVEGCASEPIAIDPIKLPRVDNESGAECQRCGKVDGPGHPDHPRQQRRG